MLNYWSISSIVLKDEAEKLWLHVETIIPEKNLFKISGNGREFYFKSTDFWGNSALGMKIAEDKQMTYIILERGGFPIAHSIYLHKTELDHFPKESLSGFRYPVIIKPINQAHGNGVMMNITGYEELLLKLKKSFEIYENMIVQEQIIGDEFRVLVVRGEVIVVINRIPPCIVGDGKQSIATLIEIENTTNPLRGFDYERPLSYIRTDAELDHCIKKYGYSRNSIPARNQKVFLRSNSNLGTGATAKDVTHMMHQETKDICIQACKQIWLEIAGVDIITNDITKPLRETWGIILEINDTPGIGGHRELTSVNSGKRILEKLFFE